MATQEKRRFVRDLLEAIAGVCDLYDQTNVPDMRKKGWPDDIDEAFGKVIVRPNGVTIRKLVIHIEEWMRRDRFMTYQEECKAVLFNRNR